MPIDHETLAETALVQHTMIPSASSDRLEIDAVGSAVVALESAVASDSGVAVVSGWALDPEQTMGEMTLEIGGRRLPLELIDRTPRPDVFARFKPSHRSSFEDVGFVALARLGPDLPAADQVSLGFPAHDRTGVSATRLRHEPGTPLDALLVEHAPLELLRPAALRRLGAVVSEDHGRQAAADPPPPAFHRRFGPQGAPAMSLIIAVGENLDVLRHTLTYLDIDPEADRLQVVLALSRPDQWEVVRKVLDQARFDLRLVVIVPQGALGVGVAARAGLEAAAAPHVTLMSDDIVPPAGNWVAGTIEDLEGADFAAPTGLPRFDGGVHGFGLPALSDERLTWSHDEVRDDLQVVAELRGFARCSPGLLAGRAEAFRAADLGWTRYQSPEPFWADALAQTVRMGGRVLSAGGDFTVTPVGDRLAGPLRRRLLEAYTLQARLTSGATT